MSHGRDDTPPPASDSERLRDLEALLVMVLEDPDPSDPEAVDRLLAAVKGRAQVRIDATRRMMQAFTGKKEGA